MKEHSTCDLPSLFVVLAISTCAVLAGAPEARAQTVRKLSISNNDAIYVPQTGRIYASVPSTAPPYGNNVVAIDPATATVVASVFVGSEPGRLAVSDDGTKLYVGLNGAAAVRVVDLPTFTAGLQFSLPGLSSYPCSNRFAADMAIQPGNTSVAAVVIGCLSSSGFEGVAIFDNGVKRPAALSAMYTYRTIAFASPSVIYAYDNEDSGWEFSRLKVDATGLSVLDTADGLLSGYYILLRSAGGRVYSSTGVVLDATRASVLAGTFASTSTVYDTALDVPRNLGFVLRDRTISAYDLNSFLPLYAFDVGDVGSPSSSSSSRSTLLTCGTRQFAVATNTTISLIDVTGVPTSLFRLRVDKKGTGTGIVRATSGSVNCGATCDADYAQGTAVTLTATADSGSVFAGWSGGSDCAGGIVTMNAALTCVATFDSQAAAGTRPFVQRLALRAGNLYYDAPTGRVVAALLTRAVPSETASLRSIRTPGNSGRPRGWAASRCVLRCPTTISSCTWGSTGLPPSRDSAWPRPPSISGSRSRASTITSESRSCGCSQETTRWWWRRGPLIQADIRWPTTRAFRCKTR